MEIRRGRAARHARRENFFSYPGSWTGAPSLMILFCYPPCKFIRIVSPDACFAMDLFAVKTLFDCEKVDEVNLRNAGLWGPGEGAVCPQCLRGTLKNHRESGLR